MTPIPLQVVLLIAVAISQIFGGISCCCLGRTLVADLNTASNATASELVSPQESSSVLETRQTGKCSKCWAKKSSPTGTEKTFSKQIYDHYVNICEDGECRCVKLAVKASTPSSPPSLSNDSLAWLSPVLGVKPEREGLTHIFAKYDVPARFGGRSWQSIACLWNN